MNIRGVVIRDIKIYVAAKLNTEERSKVYYHGIQQVME
jgi:hypothetical protein